MSGLFCRHNRFTADCPICSKGTVLESGGPRPRRSAGRTATPAAKPPAAGAQFRGPFASAGPYVRSDGERVHVRLERVPGGLRLAEWSNGALQRRAPVLPADDLVGLFRQALERDVLRGSDLRRIAEALPPPDSAQSLAVAGVSPGRTGDMREELRIEPLSDGGVRVARWVFRPGSGWQLQDAPTMLPAGRYAEALKGAAAVRGP